MSELGVISATAQQIWSHPTWDVLSIFVLLAGGFFYGIFAGKSRIAATIIYTYVAYAFFLALPSDTWFKNFSEIEEFFAKAGIFTAVFLVLAFSLGSRRNMGFAPAALWWKIFLGLLPSGKFEILAPFTKTVFANPAYHVWWVMVPLAMIIIFRRFESDT